MTDLDDLEEFLTEARQAEAVRQRQSNFRRERSTNSAGAANVAEDYAARLAERAHYRQLLRSAELDSERFRFWFSQVDQRFSLDDWRKRIDDKMFRSKNER